jgi:hypothetical protein
MPQLRHVACPECGETRRTKAGRGTRLSCKSCGHQYRAPAADDDEREQPSPLTRENASAAVRPDVSTGVKIVRPTAVEVDRPPVAPAPDPSLSADVDASLVDEVDASGVDPDDVEDQAPVVELATKRPTRGAGAGYYERRVRNAR